MNYFKSLGFYSFELVGATFNFLCSLVRVYPSFDLGVRFLLHFEGKRIQLEKVQRTTNREEKEREASLLKEKAEKNG
jgi:hypothetical protein